MRKFRAADPVMVAGAVQQPGPTRLRIIAKGLALVQNIITDNTSLMVLGTVSELYTHKELIREKRDIIFVGVIVVLTVIGILTYGMLHKYGVV